MFWCKFLILKSLENCGSRSECSHDTVAPMLIRDQTLCKYQQWLTCVSFGISDLPFPIFSFLSLEMIYGLRRNVHISEYNHSKWWFCHSLIFQLRLKYIFLFEKGALQKEGFKFPFILIVPAAWPNKSNTSQCRVCVCLEISILAWPADSLLFLLGTWQAFPSFGQRAKPTW